MRNLNQNPCAIAGLRIATARAPVRQVDQDLNAFEDNIVRFAPGNIRHKPDAARIVLKLRIIETLSRREPPGW
jgi:hypothetical protein